MAPSRNSTKAAVSALSTANIKRSNSNASRERPVKKVKLNVRKPSDDTIIVAPAITRPKRASAGRTRYSEEVFLSEDDDIKDEVVEDKQPTPTASSALSSPISPPVSVDDEDVATPAKVDACASYGDFMTYYVANNDDDAQEEPAAKPKRQLKKEKVAVGDKQPRKPRTIKAPTLPPLPPVDDQSQPVRRSSRSSTSRPGSQEGPVKDQVTARRPSQSPSSRPRSLDGPLHNQAVSRRLSRLSTARPSSRQGPANDEAAHGPSQLPGPSRPRSRQGSAQNTIPASRPVVNHPQAPQTNQPMPAQRQPQRPVVEPPTEIELVQVRYHASVAEKTEKLRFLSAALTKFVMPRPTNGTAPPGPSRSGPSRPEPSRPDAKKLEFKKAVKDKAPVDNFLAMFDDDDGSDEDENEPEPEPKPEMNAEETRHPERSGVADIPITFGIQFIMNALKSWGITRIQQQGQQTRGPNGLVIPRRPDLQGTPEGEAIDAFTNVIESGCLLVNCALPKELSGAISDLYNQIDSLINSNTNNNRPEPRFLSYRAQMDAHAAQIQNHLRRQAEAQQMGVRNQQHNIGPYHATMPPPPSGGYADRRSTPYGPAQRHSSYAPRATVPASFDGASSSPVNGGPTRSTANYVLPRSGQTMNFSFAPENSAAIQAFGSSAFPQGLPNRGPMGASPAVKTSSAPQAAHPRPVSRGRSSAPGSAKPTQESIMANDNNTHPHTANARRQTIGFTAVNAGTNNTRATGSTSKSKSPGLTRSDAVVLEDD